MSDICIAIIAGLSVIIVILSVIIAGYIIYIHKMAALVDQMITDAEIFSAYYDNGENQ